MFNSHTYHTYDALVAVPLAEARLDYLIPLGLLSRVQELHVDVDKVYTMLRLLKQVNPEYKDILIKEDEETKEQMRHLHEYLTSKERVAVFDKDIDRWRERSMEASVAAVRDPTEEHNGKSVSYVKLRTPSTN
jgi:hypothetical protein